jgi:hypothetical protein
MLGDLSLSSEQSRVLEVPTGHQMSPYLELCCLRLSANVSYQNAESDLLFLTGIFVSHRTQQRLVQKTAFPQPVVPAILPLEEVSVDGGKARIRTPKGEECCWRDYKTIATTGGIVADYQNNARLIDWVNQQPRLHPLTCLGDGHDGVWNIIAQIATPQERREILDWFHLNENLQKVGGSLQRLRQAETLLWSGQVEETLALFSSLKSKQAQNFCQYLTKHRHRIVNYDYYQAEGIPIGSGRVESAIKQIDRRTKISGAQWKAENLPQILALRTAYLNNSLS